MAEAGLSLHKNGSWVQLMHPQMAILALESFGFVQLVIVDHSWIISLSEAV